MPIFGNATSNAGVLRESDSSLHPLDTALEDLLLQAEPIVTAIVSRHRRRDMLDHSECEDVISTVRVHLLSKLRHVSDGDTDPIAAFSGYVARLTYNAVNDLFRSRNPRFLSLKKRLLALVSSDARFSLEETIRGGACRLNEQPSGPAAAVTEPPSLPPDLGDAVEALLRAAAGPLMIDDVVALLHAAEEGGHDPVACLADHDTPLCRLERREEMEMLWSWIRRLPPRQRSALLLNLRWKGNGSAIALLVLLGVTTFEALAETLAITPEDLAAIWPDLPLSDLTIAERLGVTRQQVINLRSSARKRLATASSRMRV